MANIGSGDAEHERWQSVVARASTVEANISALHEAEISSLRGDGDDDSDDSYDIRDGASLPSCAPTEASCLCGDTVNQRKGITHRPAGNYEEAFECYIDGNWEQEPRDSQARDHSRDNRDSKEGGTFGVLAGNWGGN